MSACCTKRAHVQLILGITEWAWTIFVLDLIFQLDVSGHKWYDEHFHAGHAAAHNRINISFQQDVARRHVRKGCTERMQRLLLILQKYSINIRRRNSESRADKPERSC